MSLTPRYLQLQLEYAIDKQPANGFLVVEIPSPSMWGWVGRWHILVRRRDIG